MRVFQVRSVVCCLFLFSIFSYQVSASETLRVEVGESFYLTPKFLSQEKSTIEEFVPPFFIEHNYGILTEEELEDVILSVHTQVNEYRDQNGKPPLELNVIISEQCQQHSENMASGAVPFSHDGVYERLRAIFSTIPNVRGFGENCAYNWNYYDPATMAVHQWIMSPGHRANMLGDFNHTGIGVEKSEVGGYYFTQIFVKTVE